MKSELTRTAAYGEVSFDLFGFLCQCAAIGFEASRLVMIQLLLHGLKMDPIVSVHYYAPVCAVINLCLLPFTEGMEPIYALHRVGLLVLFTNAMTAFALNMAAVFLISVGSGLILTLAGVLKDIVSPLSVLLACADVCSCLSLDRCWSSVTRSCLYRSLVTREWMVSGEDLSDVSSISLAGLVIFKTSGGK